MEDLVFKLTKIVNKKAGLKMIERSIIIFPKFTNNNLIEEIRKKYDPLFGLIKPHITLVFPFISRMTKSDIDIHVMNCLKDISPFKLVMKGITGDSGGYLFLNVKKGNDSVIELHDKLYQGIFKEYLNISLTYKPHLTVGKVDNEESFNKILNELKDFDYYFETEVDKIYVEVIDESNKSTIEAEYSFA